MGFSYKCVPILGFFLFNKGSDREVGVVMALNAKIEIEISSRVYSLGTGTDFGMLLLIHKADYIKTLKESQ
jgi:hypothetical protein